MSTVGTAMEVAHLVTAAVWIGAIALVTALVLPAIRGERLPAEAIDLLGDLAMPSRLAALVVLLSGGHLLGTRYGIDGLLAGGAGHLVLAMVAGWLVFTGLVEGGIARLTDDPFDDTGYRLLQAATLVGLVILAIGASF